MEKLEHIGIAVKNLSQSISLFEVLLNTPCYKEEFVASESVRTAFFAVGSQKIELLESAEPQNPISKFIDKKGEGIHHIAFLVNDIKSEMKRLSAAGFELLYDEPRQGADNKLVCFLHPKNTNHVLIELCMENPSPVNR